MFKKIIISLMTCMSILVTGCSSQSNEHKNSLTVGTNAEFPPFSYREGKEIVGFDIDIAKEVSKRLNKTLEFKDMPFDALLPDLLLGHIDFIAAGMTYTEERAKRVAFTKPYLGNDPLIIITNADLKISNLDNLKGKTVAVNEGYTADLYLSEKQDLNLIRLNSPADAFLALKNKRCDAFVSAKSTVQSFLETQEGYASNTVEGPNDNYALIVSKSNPQLLDEIQTALDAMEQDGTINQLKAKWGL